MQDVGTNEQANEQNKPQVRHKPDSSGLMWLVQSVTGLLLVFTLGLHMVAHHFVVEGGLRDFQQVLDYVNNPLIFAIEVIFLIVATVHAMIGVRAILFDLGPGPGAVRLIEVGVRVVGAGTIVYGIWLALEIQALA